jgi:hypothetical protein
LKRFECDAQWQREFGQMAEALAAMREHTAAGLQLREADELKEAQAELDLADEEKERAALFEHALRDLVRSCED